VKWTARLELEMELIAWYKLKVKWTARLELEMVLIAW
jgi:hypothetical protein